MFRPKTTLSNPYYSFSNNVLYRISSSQPSDGCGEQLVEEEEADNKNIFPYFTVSYKGTGDDSTNTYTVVYWLQDMIAVGDTLDGNGKFVQKLKCENGANNTYISSFVESFTEDVKTMINNNQSIETITKALPHYCFNKSALTAEQKKVTITVNGQQKNVEYDSVTGYTPLTQSSILTMVCASVDEKTENYANGLLKTYNKKLKNTTVVNITSGNITNL